MFQAVPKFILKVEAGPKGFNFNPAVCVPSGGDVFVVEKAPFFMSLFNLVLEGKGEIEVGLKSFQPGFITNKPPIRGNFVFPCSNEAKSKRDLKILFDRCWINIFILSFFLHWLEK